MESRSALRAGYALAIGGAAAALVVLIVGASTIAALGHEVPKELWAIGAALAGAIVGILAPSPHGRREAASPLAAAEAAVRAANSAAKEEASGHPCVPAAEAVKRVDRAGQKAVNELDVSDSPHLGGAIAAASRVVQAFEDEHRKAQEAVDKAANDANKAAAEAAAAPAGTPEAEQKADAKAKADAASEGARAELAVHGAAEDAARKAAGTAAVIEHEPPLDLKALFTEPKIIVPLLLFFVAITLALLLGLGVIHTGVKVCRLKSGTIHSCVYYARVTHQIATVLISIASAAAGALIGIFAKSPAEAAEPVHAAG